MGDFSLPCPVGWQLVGGVCAALSSSTYTGSCLPFANLDGFSEQSKHDFAELCQVEFCAPLKPVAISAEGSSEQACEPSDAHVCPAGWSLIGTVAEYCFGEDYAGNCRPLISVSELMRIGKRSFMSACAVSWACDASLSLVSPPSAVADESVAPRFVVGEPSGPVAEDGRLHVTSL